MLDVVHSKEFVVLHGWVGVILLHTPLYTFDGEDAAVFEQGEVC